MFCVMHPLAFSTMTILIIEGVSVFWIVWCHNNQMGINTFWSNANLSRSHRRFVTSVYAKSFWKKISSWNLSWWSKVNKYWSESRVLWQLFMEFLGSMSIWYLHPETLQCACGMKHLPNLIAFVVMLPQFSVCVWSGNIYTQDPTTVW
jgi:hypothetical protein